MSLPDITTSKVGIIYVYYERINQQKNQTNLSFFIKYGLNEKNWIKMNLETLFVINGHICELLIPTKSNIHILTEDNCSDWEGWYNGIKFFENKYKKPIWDIFDYLCLINAGAFGPIFEENPNEHWLFPFYNKMVKDHAVLCSPCMSFLDKSNLSGPGPRVVPIFSLLRCTKSLMELLMNTQITLGDKLSTNSNNLLFQDTNTVFGKKKNKTDATLSGEYGLSRILLKNKYKITSLLYDFNCNNPINWTVNNNIEPDRFLSFNGDNIPLTTIFIKNIWRELKSYVSLPVLYHECKSYYYKKLKMKALFEDFNLNPNYDLQKIIDVDHAKHYWHSKQEYYDKFGYAEENILFTKPMKNFRGCLIYAHYDVNNIVRDYVIQTINVFRYLGYDILFYTASDKLENISILPCRVFHTKNTGAGTDWRIWLMGCYYLKKNKLIYDYIFMLNDSIILPINGINNFENTIIKMRESSDFWGHWESNEIEWHIIGTPIEFKYKLIDKVIEFIDTNITKCKEKIDFVFILEVKFAKYLINSGYKHNTVIKINDLDNFHKLARCPVFQPFNLNKWINNPDTFAIKWKYSISYLNYNIVSPECNYLTKFLYYGKYGCISEAEKNGIFTPSSDCY